MLHKILTYIKRRGRTSWKEVLAIFLLLVGIYFFRSNRRELISISQYLNQADLLWLMIGLVVMAFCILFQSLLYVYSYRSIGVRIPLHQATDLFLKRNLLSVFLPAGGISSLAYAPSGLARRGITKKQTNQAAGIYAFIGLLTVFLVGLPLLGYALLWSKPLAHSLPAIVILLAFLLALFLLLRSFRQKGSIYRFTSKRFPRQLSSFESYLNASFSSSQLLKATLASLLVEVCGIAHVFIAGKALQIPVSLEASALAYIISVLLMIISPFLRGLGAVELSMVYVLHQYGLPPVQALALTLVYRLLEFWLPLVSGFFCFAWRGRHIFLRLFPSLLVFILGVVNILSVITTPIAARLRFLRRFIPVDSINASNMLVLVTGISLLILSAFLIRGQRNAWIAAIILAALSLLGHMFKAFDYEEALLAGSVLIVLALSSGQYKLKSNPRLIQLGFRFVFFIFLAVLLFGFIGFYYIDKRHFGLSFNWYQALRYSANNFLLLYHSELHPATRFGAEYILWLHVLGFICWLFLIFVLLKPVFVKTKNFTSHLEKAKDLIRLYGNSSVDYFKTSRDMLIYLSDHYEAFVAYRIANGFAIVLEEPVCPEHQKKPVLEEFDDHCRKMGLKSAFYRVDENDIPHFKLLKKHKLVIGQEAILELDKFSLEGREKKSLRNALNSLEKKGYTFSLVPPPLPEELLVQLRKVSDEWLSNYHKKESVFSQGMFLEEEVRHHPVIVVKNQQGTVIAFLNIIPDFVPGECTYDLIRKTVDAPGGCMDALIIELIQYARSHGFKYLNLGLVPMAGIRQPDNTAEELIRFAYDKIKRFRHYSGLREFKEKYASIWLNKYLVYENDFDLLQLPVALNKVMQPRSHK